MNAIVKDVAGRYADVKLDIKPGIKTKPKSSGIMSWWNKQKFDKIWLDRNIDYGEVLIDSLEYEVMEFNQDYFIEDNKEVSAKLKRIGFEPIDINTKYDFVTFVYNKKHNVAIGLYKPSLKDVMKKAKDVVSSSNIDGETARIVFTEIVNSFSK